MRVTTAQTIIANLNRYVKLLPLLVWLLILTLATASCAGFAAEPADERIEADVECSPTDEPLLYTCVFTLTGKESGQPVDGAEFTIGADMPSMAGVMYDRPMPYRWTSLASTKLTFSWKCLASGL